MSRCVRGKQPCVLAAVLAVALWVAPGWAATVDHPIPLNYNFHGMVHGSAELGVPDDPSGYRAISDRGLYLDSGDPYAFGTQPLVGITGLPYALFNTLSAGQLDMVHLGNRHTMAAFETTAPGSSGNRGIFPTWMPDAASCDHTVPQVTSISPGIVLDDATEIGVLYMISNGGGTFDVVLHFTDSTTATVTLNGPDWYGGNRGEPTITANQPVSYERMLATYVDGMRYNSYTGCSNTDSASLQSFKIDNSGPNLNVTEGIIHTALMTTSVAGKTLDSITFQNPQSGKGYAIYAVTVRTGLADNATCATAQVVGLGELVVANTHVPPGTNPATECGYGEDTNGVWFQYTATTAGTLEARTCGAQFDSTIAVYTGTCGALTSVVCNDDGCGLASRVQWAGVAGTTYYIYAAGLYKTSGQFTFALDKAHTDITMPLQFNWNGICHGASEQTTETHENRCDLNGFRSIADRGLLCDGAQSDALNYGGTIGWQGMQYTIYSTALQSDMVHLGDRTRVANGARNWSPSCPPSNDNGLRPAWLSADDQTGTQYSSMASLNAVFGPNTKVGVLYHTTDVSNPYYASFDVTLEFSNIGAIAIPVLSTDWFVTNGQVMPLPGPGLEAQRLLGIYHAVSSTDRATDAGSGGRLKINEAVISTAALQAAGIDPTGETLLSISFGNPISGNSAGDTYTSAFGIYAATLRDPASYNPEFGPGGVGTVTPNQLVAGAAGKMTVSVSRGSGSPNNITSVVVDGSSVGLSSTLNLYDDGTNGDAQPNDNLWTCNIAFFVDMPAGGANLPFVVTDAQSRTATGNIVFTIIGAAGQAVPETVLVGSSFVAEVAMSSDQTATPGIAVVLDGTPLGLGSSIALNDAGTGGDVTANDGTYSGTVRVPLSAALAATALPFTASQSGHTYTSTLSVTPAAPAAIVAPWPQGVSGTTRRYQVDLYPATEITSVTADLAPLGLGAVALNDSGTNGDQLAGDGIWSREFTVPAGVAPGVYSLPYLVNDSHAATVGGAVSFTVLAEAPMAPVAVTGWNRDIVVERQAIATEADGFNPYAESFDLPNNIAFYERGTIGGNAAGTKGLPVGGALVSEADGTTEFQLPPYGTGTGLVPNALLLDGTKVSSGTLTLTTPAPYLRLAVLLSGANASATSLGNITLTYTDDTTASGPTYSALRYYAPDWYWTGGIRWYGAFLNTGRVWLDYGGWIDDDPTPGENNPRLYQMTFYLGTQGLHTKPIKSITFGQPVDAGSAAILAISGEVYTPTTALSPISVTGFTRDVILEASAVPGADPNAPYAGYFELFDTGSDRAFYEKGAGTGAEGLPVGGLFTSSGDGVTQFQLQPYTGANVLYLDPNTPTGTLTLAPAAQKAYGRLAILATARNAAQTGVGTITLTFADSTTADLTYNAHDWYWQPAHVALNGIGVVSTSGSFFVDSVFEPRLYHTTLDLAGHVPALNTKAIVSLTFGLADASAATGVFAVSGVAAAPALCPGDGNCDHVINWRDIDYLIAAQNDNVSSWTALFPAPGPSCAFLNLDTSGDSHVNWRDIDPFIALMNTTCH